MVAGVAFCTFVVNENGNRNVPYLWNDDDKRNLNLNYFENDWNENYRFAAVRNDYFFTALKIGRIFLRDFLFPTAHNFA